MTAPAGVRLTARDYYRRAVYAPRGETLRGDDYPEKTPAWDNSGLRAQAKKALDLLDAALKRAQGIVANETESTWAKLKSAVTGTNLAAVQGEVKQLAVDVGRMHDAFSKFDQWTLPAKLQDFVKACAQMADLSVLTDTVERNDLTTLAKEVGSATAKEVVHQAQEVAKPIAEVGASWLKAIWNELPWYGKVLVVGVPSVAVFLGVKKKIDSL